MEKLEETILTNLIFNEEYSRKVLPYLKNEYFIENSEKIIFDIIEKYIKKYNSLPTKNALYIELEKKEIQEEHLNHCKGLISRFESGSENLSYLIDTTEKFCKDKALYNAFLRGVKILDGKEKNLTKDALPELMRDALAVSFDTNIGHDYFEDEEKRYEYYTRVEHKIPFGIKMFDKVTNGGMSRKTLNAILAGTGVGKTYFKCDVAANVVMNGNNVLYLTAEVSEEEITKRIDAKLLDIDIGNLSYIDKQEYLNRFSCLKKKNHGSFIVKEYPTASAHAGHIESLLNDLKLKKNFIPDLIVFDYINIFNSKRYKSGGVNSYTVVKATAEEFRGLCVKYNMAGLTSTQVIRSGLKSSDLELSDTSESVGLPFSLDSFFALILTEELEENGQIMVKQLKNRYKDKSYYKKFLLGMDRSKMKLFDIEIEDMPKLADSNKESDIHINKKVDSSKFDTFTF